MPKGKEYGKDTTPNPAVSKYAGLSEDVATGNVTWSDVDGRILKAALVAITEDGCAIILGKTKDGGALSITLLGPGQPVKRWPNTGASAESFLEELRALASS